MGPRVARRPAPRGTEHVVTITTPNSLRWSEPDQVPRVFGPGPNSQRSRAPRGLSSINPTGRCLLSQPGPPDGPPQVAGGRRRSRQGEDEREDLAHANRPPVDAGPRRGSGSAGRRRAARLVEETDRSACQAAGAPSSVSPSTSPETPTQNSKGTGRSTRTPAASRCGRCGTRAASTPSQAPTPPGPVATASSTATKPTACRGGHRAARR